MRSVAADVSSGQEDGEIKGGGQQIIPPSSLIRKDTPHQKRDIHYNASSHDTTLVGKLLPPFPFETPIKTTNHTSPTFFYHPTSHHPFSRSLQHDTNTSTHRQQPLSSNSDDGEILLKLNDNDKNNHTNNNTTPSSPKPIIHNHPDPVINLDTSLQRFIIDKPNTNVLKNHGQNNPSILCKKRSCGVQVQVRAKKRRRSRLIRTCQDFKKITGKPSAQYKNKRYQGTREIPLKDLDREKEDLERAVHLLVNQLTTLQNSNHQLALHTDDCRNSLRQQYEYAQTLYASLQAKLKCIQETNSDLTKKFLLCRQELQDSQGRNREIHCRLQDVWQEKEVAAQGLQTAQRREESNTLELESLEKHNKELLNNIYQLRAENARIQSSGYEAITQLEGRAHALSECETVLENYKQIISDLTSRTDNANSMQEGLSKKFSKILKHLQFVCNHFVLVLFRMVAEVREEDRVGNKEPHGGADTFETSQADQSDEQYEILKEIRYLKFAEDHQVDKLLDRLTARLESVLSVLCVAVSDLKQRHKEENKIQQFEIKELQSRLEDEKLALNRQRKQAQCHFQKVQQSDETCVSLEGKLLIVEAELTALRDKHERRLSSGTEMKQSVAVLVSEHEMENQRLRNQVLNVRAENVTLKERMRQLTSLLSNTAAHVERQKKNENVSIWPSFFKNNCSEGHVEWQKFRTFVHDLAAETHKEQSRATDALIDVRETTEHAQCNNVLLEGDGLSSDPDTSLIHTLGNRNYCEFL